MADQTPIVFLGGGPNFSGITQLKTADRLAGIVNDVDFGNDAIMASDGVGAVSAVTLAANTILGNNGSGVQALTTGDAATLLSIKSNLTSLDDVTITGASDKEALVYNNGTGDWENTALVLNDITNVEVGGATTGQRLEFDGANWDAVTPKERVVVNDEVVVTTTAQDSSLYPVNVLGGAVTINPPATPSVSDYFIVSDSRANAATNNITVDFVAAGQNFHGASANYVVNVDRGSARFRYINATIGWVLE